MPKAKKTKKTKKQRRKELEEKRRLEEELLRQQQEEERKRQEELERQRREEEERLRLLKEKRRKEELVRLEKEEQEDIDLHEKRENDLNTLLNEEYQQIEWKKHLKCDPFPDISNERELNNFLTQWRESQISINKDKFDVHNDINSCLQDIENGYKLLPILHDVIFDSIQKNNFSKFDYSKSRFLEIGDVAQDKINNLTKTCLNTEYFNSAFDAGMKEDGDVIKSEIKKNIKLGLWASSMSNAFKNSKIEFKRPIFIKLELPKQIAMKAKCPLSCRVIQYSLNFFIYLNQSTKYQAISPIIDMQLFKLPEPPRSKYCSKNNSNQSQGQWLVQNKENNECDIWEYDSSECISISCKIPNYVYIPDKDNINLGWFDYKINEWRSDDFKDISFDSENRILTFMTYHLSPTAIISTKGTYYEYLDWKLIPSGVERCRIALHTKCNDALKIIDIEVIGSQCKLLPNDDREIPELKHIYNKLLQPHQLIYLLKISGINLCYKNDKNHKLYKSENILDKNDEIESLTHLEISTIAALFEVSMSKWNRMVNNDNMIIFRVRKPLTENETNDLKEEQKEKEQINETEDIIVNDGWHTIMINEEKVTFIDCRETSQEINLETPLTELSHKTLLRCLTPYCTEDNIRDLENASFKFKETIRRMLNLLNLFRV